MTPKTDSRLLGTWKSDRASTLAECAGGDLLAALLSAAVGLAPAWALQASVPYWSFAMAGPRFGNPVRIGRPGD